MLNPELNITSLAAEFRHKRRIQIRDVMLPHAAEELYRCLDQDVPWGVAYIDGEQSTLVSADKLAVFTQDDWVNLNNKVQARAVDKFQFIYNSYMMVTAYKEKRDPGLLLHSMVEYINAPPFLDLLRGVTGVSSIMKADAQATRYIPGHYLKKHNDQVANQYREVAYVLNLTKDWQADWGGLLQFMDENGKVTDTFLPTFNSLSLFQVPMWHHVSYVAPFVPHGRYAITGWGMSRPPTA
ncbi:MAG TPA: 2OG-Fe(II) oxygenase family protein [Gammaproteobacteria bacterium]|nr:2OG-Fe(II) oxygenase family protein [Gammaproteobacteria bacterium]